MMKITMEWKIQLKRCIYNPGQCKTVSSSHKQNSVCFSVSSVYCTMNQCCSWMEYPLKFIKDTKFLGIVFDSKLSFITYLKLLKKKCFKAMNVLMVLSKTKWGADSSTLMNLYRTLIRSKLDYESIIYGSARKSYIQFLDTVHHQ